MAVSWSPDDASSLGMVSAVVDRSQTTLSRDLHPLLLKLGGLESDHAGVLGGRLLQLQSREMGIGVMFLATTSVTLSLHEELGLDVALGGVVKLSCRALTGLVFISLWKRASTGLVLGCGLAAGTWHLALDGPGWHGPLWTSGAAGRRLGTGLASYPLDGA